MVNRLDRQKVLVEMVSPARDRYGFVTKERQW